MPYFKLRMISLRHLAPVVCCLAIAACSSKADRIESGLRKGAELLSQGSLDKASVEVRNVLQIDPKNAQAFYIAGQVEDSRFNLRGAYANYTKVIELKPDHVQAKLGLARLHLMVGETAEADQLIDSVLATDVANLRALTLKAVSTGRQGHGAEALAEAARIQSTGQPLLAESSLLLAGIYVNAKDYAQALKVLDQALAAEPRNIQLLQMAAEVASAPEGDPALAPRAAGYFKTATNVAPKNVELWNAWAVAHIRRKELDQAEAVLREAVRLDPDDSARTLSVLGFLARFRGADVAEKEFERAIESHPKDTALRFAQAELLASQNRGDDVKRVLDGIVSLGKDAPSGLTARAQLAALSLGEGHVEEARTTLAELLKVNPRDSAALALRGRILLGDGKASDAVIDLRAVAKDRPGSVEIANLLAQAHRAAGNPELARESLVDAVKFKPDDPQLHLLVAADMAASKNYAEAMVEADTAIKVAPRFIGGYIMKVELAAAQGNAMAAEKAALAMQDAFPDRADGFIRLGRIYAAQKRFDAALKQFDAGAKAAPLSAEPVVSAISMLVAERKYAEAKTRIDALLAVKGRAGLAHQLSGELAIAQGNLALAESSFRKVIADGAAPVAVYKNLAAVLVAQKNYPAAFVALDDGDKAYPQNMSLAMARAEWLGSAGRTDDAVAAYEAILKRAPKNDMAANNLAAMLTDLKGDKASLDRALQIASRFEKSGVPAYLDTLAMVHYRLAQYPLAVGLLEEAVAQVPNEPLLQLHLGMALVKQGDAQRGKDLMRKAMASGAALPNLSEARTLVGPT